MAPESDSPTSNWFDPRGFPIVLQCFPPHPTDQEAIAWQRAYDAFFRGPGRNKKYATIADLSNVRSTSSRQRKLVVDHEKEWTDYDARYCVATALVCSNALTHGMITALYWLTPPKYPYKKFSTMDEARVWVTERLKEAGAI